MNVENSKVNMDDISKQKIIQTDDNLFEEEVQVNSDLKDALNGEELIAPDGNGVTLFLTQNSDL